MKDLVSMVRAAAPAPGPYAPSPAHAPALTGPRGGPGPVAHTPVSRAVQDAEEMLAAMRRCVRALFYTLFRALFGLGPDLALFFVPSSRHQMTSVVASFMRSRVYPNQSPAAASAAGSSPPPAPPASASGDSADDNDNSGGTGAFLTEVPSRHRSSSSSNTSTKGGFYAGEEENEGDRGTEESKGPTGYPSHLTGASSTALAAPADAATTPLHASLRHALGRREQLSASAQLDQRRPPAAAAAAAASSHRENVFNQLSMVPPKYQRDLLTHHTATAQPAPAAAAAGSGGGFGPRPSLAPGDPLAAHKQEFDRLRNHHSAAFSHLAREIEKLDEVRRHFLLCFVWSSGEGNDRPGGKQRGP